MLGLQGALIALRDQVKQMEAAQVRMQRSL